MRREKLFSHITVIVDLEAKQGERERERSSAQAGAGFGLARYEHLTIVSLAI